MVTQNFSGQTSYLTMKILTFAKDKKIGFFITTANLSYVDTSVTTQTSTQLAALEPCVKAKVGTLLTS